MYFNDVVSSCFAISLVIWSSLSNSLICNVAAILKMTGLSLPHLIGWMMVLPTLQLLGRIKQVSVFFDLITPKMLTHIIWGFIIWHMDSENKTTIPVESFVFVYASPAQQVVLCLLLTVDMQQASNSRRRLFTLLILLPNQTPPSVDFQDHLSTRLASYLDTL